MGLGWALAPTNQETKAGSLEIGVRDRAELGRETKRATWIQDLLTSESHQSVCV